MADGKVKRGEPERKKAADASVFLARGGDIGMIAVPVSTLSDEYHDEPTEPEDTDRVPDPEPPGTVRRVVQRLAHRKGPDDDRRAHRE